MFEDVTNVGRARRAAAYLTPSGASGLVDFDNDGDRDLFIACGHFLENIREIDDATAYRVPNVLLLNTGDGRSSTCRSRCGDGLAVVDQQPGRRASTIWTTTATSTSVILNAQRRGRRSCATSRTAAALAADPAPRSAEQPRRRRSASPGRRRRSVQVAEVHSGRGYQSHFGTRLHFGLGTSDRVDRVEVRWIGGGVDVFTDVRGRPALVLVEWLGRGSDGRQRLARMMYRASRIVLTSSS